MLHTAGYCLCTLRGLRRGSRAVCVIQPWSTVTHAAHRASTAFGLYEIRASKCLNKGCCAGDCSATGRAKNQGCWRTPKNRLDQLSGCARCAKLSGECAW
jgi:hypothetical protein